MLIVALDVFSFSEVKKFVEAAVACAAEFSGMKVLALTVVTGLTDEDLTEIGYENSTQDQVLKLAKLAQVSGCHGIVASAAEVSMLRSALNEPLLIVTPGIRPLGADIQDQRRRPQGPQSTEIPE